MGRKAGPARPGPVYDDAMKVLARDDLDAVLSLVGVHSQGAQPMTTELPGSAMHADLIARTSEGIVHVEFVKDRDPDLDLRMVAYWRRIRGQDGHRHTPLAQFVLVLGDDLTVPDRCLDGDREVLRWSVVRLSDLDPAPLLARPATAALAALARGTTTERMGLLTAAAELITSTDRGRSQMLLSAAKILASIVLPAAIIETALKEGTTMPVLVRDTPLGRELYEEARQEGRQQGRQEGRHALLSVTILMLQRTFGDDPRIGAIAERMAELPDEERVSKLTTATSLDDLDN